jgi:hypothetical protein
VGDLWVGLEQEALLVLGLAFGVHLEEVLWEVFGLEEIVLAGVDKADVEVLVVEGVAINNAPVSEFGDKGVQDIFQKVIRGYKTHTDPIKPDHQRILPITIQVFFPAYIKVQIIAHGHNQRLAVLIQQVLGFGDEHFDEVEHFVVRLLVAQLVADVVELC